MWAVASGVVGPTGEIRASSSGSDGRLCVLEHRPTVGAKVVALTAGENSGTEEIAWIGGMAPSWDPAAGRTDSGPGPGSDGGAAVPASISILITDNPPDGQVTDSYAPGGAGPAPWL